MSEWEDASTWSRSEAKTAPKAWVKRVGIFRLTVHHHIYQAPDVWVASCCPVLFSCVVLKSKDVDEAKCQALAKLQSILQDTLAELASEQRISSDPPQHAEFT